MRKKGRRTGSTWPEYVSYSRDSQEPKLVRKHGDEKLGTREDW